MFCPSFIPKVTKLNAQGEPIEVEIQYKNRPRKLRVLPGSSVSGLGVDLDGPFLLLKEGAGKFELSLYILLNLEEIYSRLARYDGKPRKAPGRTKINVKPIKEDEIVLEDKRIVYQIRRSARRKRIQFSSEDGHLVFHIPSGVEDEELKNIIRRNAAKVISFFESMNRPKIQDSPLMPITTQGEDIFLVTEKGPVQILLQRAKRKTISVSMTEVDKVVLKLPMRASQREAINWLRTKKKWILGQIDRLSKASADSQVIERAIFSADGSISLFGTQRAIRWVDKPREQGITDEEVKISRPHQGEDAQQTQARLIALVKKWALPKIELLVKVKALEMGPSRYPLNRVFLTSAKSRWGSCNSAGHIRIHWNAVFISEEELDYLITHEVAHLHEMNHSARFWAKVAAFCPNYKALQTRLKKRTLISI